MIKSETCAHGKAAPLSTLRKLHDSQAGIGRHKCTNCAYEKGFAAGLSGVVNSEQSEKCNEGSAAPISVLGALPESQAGSGRHKCTNCAYQNGYEDGLSAQRRELKKNDVIPDIFANSFPDVDYESMAVKEAVGNGFNIFPGSEAQKLLLQKKLKYSRQQGA